LDFVKRLSILVSAFPEIYDILDAVKMQYTDIAEINIELAKTRRQLEDTTA
jgi:hypothetical protein